MLMLAPQYMRLGRDLCSTVNVWLGYRMLICGCRALGREPLWIDLEADPKIDRDNPPDLAKYTVAAEPKPEGGAPAAASSSNAAAAPKAAAAPAAAAAGTSGGSGAKDAKKGGKEGKDGKKAAPVVSEYEVQQRLTDVERNTREVLEKVRGSCVVSGRTRPLFHLCWIGTCFRLCKV